MKKEELKLSNVKGTFDYYSDELLIRNQIIDTLKNVFLIYDYLPLETPILCNMDLLSSKYAGGAEILKEVYQLTDQGKRNLGLRYDLTVPFSKVMGMTKNLSLPFKRYEIGKVFRDGPVKVGRNREFYQCDVDVCGISNLEVEIEFFQLTNRAFKDLDLDIEIHYNNRKLLVGILEELKITENISAVILVLDKKDKILKEELVKELLELNLSEETINILFDLLSKDLNYLLDYFQETNNEILKEGLEEIKTINDYVKSLNLTNCIFKPFLARGLEIYTGTIWEIFAKDGYRSSLGGGGRYDDIITNFINDGNKYPAVGMSFGLEPIYELMKSKNLSIKSNPDILVFGFDLNPEVMSISNELRNNNFKVKVEMNRGKLKKALDYANKNEINYVIIIGENELKENKYLLKDMLSSSQESYSQEELITFLKERLNK
ncbi:MAG: histidine--tRNA ligase [Mollicutes bacterium]|nr:histidine--tRNA ligase [Mollicutes bacterium]